MLIQLKLRFSNHTKVKINEFGLDKGACSFQVCEAGPTAEASSAFTTCGGSAQNLPVKSASDVLTEILQSSGADYIDLLTINCEGCEYGVLESVIDAGLLGCIKRLQFSRQAAQVPYLVPCFCRIQEHVCELFDPVYEYAWAWEAH